MNDIAHKEVNYQVFEVLRSGREWTL